MNTKQLLLEFSKQVGTAGREESAHAFAINQLEKFGKVEVSPTGSLICIVKEPQNGGINILLDAHLDEIGLMVRYIEDDGFIRVSESGGVDERLTTASPVNIHTKTGVLTGVICSIPPHLQKGERKNPVTDDLYIDTGLSGEDAKKLISLGDMITFQSHPRELLNNMICGKALDDRAGCASLLKAAELLGDKLKCGLSIGFTSMEEIGGQGAKTTAYRVNPTHALVVDVSFAMTPDADKHKCGELGKGPMIGFAPVLSAEISQQLTELAERESIPYQYEVMGRGTGTNADSIVTAHNGVKTALLSIPQRYMHTPNEVVSVDDVDNTAKLIAAWILDMQKQEGK